MDIQKMKVSDIKIGDWNPRETLKPGDPVFEELRLSLREFGMVQLLVWDKQSGMLVGGHQRLSVLIDEGVEEVDVCVVDYPPHKMKALGIALNKIQGCWNEEKLAALLQDLDQIPDFDVSLTGFEKPEIGALFDEYLAPDLDAVEEASESEGPPVTARGDLIPLGPHRLFCGDSGSEDDLRSLLGEQKIQLVYTDPPYNCAYDSSNRPVNNGDSRWRPIANDAMSQSEYELWLRNIFSCVKPFLDRGTPLYCWGGHRQFSHLGSTLTALGFHVSNVITWIKPCPSPGYGDYQMASEFAIYAWLKDGAAHRWYGPPTEVNVWESSRDSVSQLIHPSQKPVSLAQRAIKNSSQRGDLVFDGFAGSGSTIIAAQSLERVCYAVELDPLYCDAIARRYIKTFGRESVSPEVYARYGKEV